MSHDDLVIRLGKSKGCEGGDVIIGLRVEYCDRFRSHQIVENEVIIFVSDCEIVLQLFCESTTQYALAHGLVVV